jgi:hypothetical protein
MSNMEEDVLGCMQQPEKSSQGSPPELEHARPDHCNIGAIRMLMRCAFTAKELWRFCQERPVFSPILDSINPESDLDNMIDTLLEYCDKRVLFSELLSEVSKFNPAQYERQGFGFQL